MITILSLKFSCEKCISGHRTTICNHLQRPLYEIKGKGRPISQCGYCRVKRQTQRVKTHHQCKCGDSMQFESRKRVKRKKIITSGFGVGSSFLVLFNDNINCEMSSSSSLIKRYDNELSTAIKLTATVSAKRKDMKINDVDDGTLTVEVPLVYDKLVVLEEIAGLDRNLIDNPCQCHIDGHCICAALSQKSKKECKSKELQNGVQMKNITQDNSKTDIQNSPSTSLDYLIKELQSQAQNLARNQEYLKAFQQEASSNMDSTATKSGCRCSDMVEYAPKVIERGFRHADSLPSNSELSSPCCRSNGNSLSVLQKEQAPNGCGCKRNYHEEVVPEAASYCQCNSSNQIASCCASAIPTCCGGSSTNSNCCQSNGLVVASSSLSLSSINFQDFPDLAYSNANSIQTFPLESLGTPSFAVLDSPFQESLNPGGQLNCACSCEETNCGECEIGICDPGLRNIFSIVESINI